MRTALVSNHHFWNFCELKKWERGGGGVGDIEFNHCKSLDDNHWNKDKTRNLKHFLEKKNSAKTKDLVYNLLFVF